MDSGFRRELSFWADFNSVDEHRWFKASLRFADSPERPIEGEWVRLHDDEGNAVLGVVERIDGMILHVRPEMTSWRSSEIAIDTPHFLGGAPPYMPMARPSTEGLKPAHARGVQVK